MAEENKKQEAEKEQTKSEVSKTPSESKAVETEVKEKISKTEKKTKEEVKKPKKTEAIVNGKDLPISTKYAVAICRYIKGKNIDDAILILQEVKNFKRAIPMKGEIPHRKGKIMSGKYPIKAVQEMIKLLKSLKANAIVNELELEKYIVAGKANVASRPYRRFGRTRFKRTHVQLKLIQPKKKSKKQTPDKTPSEKNKKV